MLPKSENHFSENACSTSWNRSRSCVLIKSSKRIVAYAAARRKQRSSRLTDAISRNKTIQLSLIEGGSRRRPAAHKQQNMLMGETP
jgi:hypothetical protein